MNEMPASTSKAPASDVNSIFSSDANRLLTSTRSHRSTENSVCWLLHGDDSRTRQVHRQHNLAVLRRMAFKPLPSENSAQIGIAAKRKRARCKTGRLLKILSQHDEIAPAIGCSREAPGQHACPRRLWPTFEHLFFLWHTVDNRSTSALPEGTGSRVGTEIDMPIYEYICQDCDHRFDRYWPTAASAQDQQPDCPDCASTATRRTISQVAVLGKLGGLTPQEQSAASAETAKTASYTPKEQIQTFQANKQRKREQGR